MPKGGHAASGRAPDPNALRRDRSTDRSGWAVLPAAGRQGEPPEWPLLFQTLREQTLWAEMWAKPQAIMWEQQQIIHEVAMFVRTLAVAESPDSGAEKQKLVRQYFDALGLSVQGMLRNRWMVGQPAEDEPAAEDAPAPAQGANKSGRKSARSRLSVVNGDGSQ